MKEKYRAPKGFQDIIPPDSLAWQHIDDCARGTFHRYGYDEIRIPVVEHTEIFSRSIGESTDIVEKEMYTFEDRAGRSLTLRPEGTAPMVRCYIQHGLHTESSPQKYYYSGPMFRYERPQKGRFRQFYQIGAEAFGIDDPYIDAEMMSMIRDFLYCVGLGSLTYEVNSIGCVKCRPDYKKALHDHVYSRIDRYCDDCKRRYETNIMRVLDCKVPGCVEASGDAPLIRDFLCEGCKEHFNSFRDYLGLMGVEHSVNPRIVRGLDYYTRTIFEITTTELGSQNAVVAGGRYDKLVEDLGGPPVPGVGFALGMERLAELISGKMSNKMPVPDLFIICMNEDARKAGVAVAHELRERGLRCETNYTYASLSKQVKRADKAGARYVFVIGTDEVQRGIVKFKRLSDAKEGEIALDDHESMIKIISDNGS
ncbi:MAG: histidine--tRNA ligase [Nitrospirota bacterium]|nr:MAG: histidine--tRNA ligase [Nitrospirota bacterium]